MNINLKLSTRDIERAIRKLSRIKDYFEDDANKLVDVLVTDGAEEAQDAYGDWGVAAVPVPAIDGEGYIMVVGDYPAIAEFGAGNATQYPSEYFETHELDAEVWPGSYSLYKGTMDYYMLKHWKFGGQWYEEVPPHLGLYKAKLFLLEHSTEIAQEVIRFD